MKKYDKVRNSFKELLNDLSTLKKNERNLEVKGFLERMKQSIEMQRRMLEEFRRLKGDTNNNFYEDS